jgi:putative MATE family efflux protein
VNSELNLLKDPIPSLIKKIALPASIGTLFQTLFNIVDTFFAGKISPDALSALAKSFPIYFIIIAACVGVTVGGTSLIANSIGENNKSKIHGYFVHTIIYAIIISILITLTGLIFAPYLFELMGSENEVIKLGLSYTNVIFGGSIIFIMLVALNSLLHADGDTKTYRNVLILSFLLNILLNPLFIFGFGPIPAFGISGIGIATIVAQFIGLIIIFLKVSKSNRIENISLKDFNFNFNTLTILFFQSAPISVALLLISVGNFIILSFIGVFGEFATAGYGSAARFEQILLLPVLGLNTAIISIIGQNFGSKNYLRVKESYFKAIIYGFSIMIVSGLIIFISADKIISIFSDNQEVINYGSSYLKISALIFPAYPIFFISNGFFMAIKKSSYSMYLNIIRNVVLPIPTILVAKSFDGGYDTFFWSYCFFNWLYVICLFIYVTTYIRKNLHQAS